MMICPKCKIEMRYEDPSYCHECGAFVVNYCSNDDCELNNGTYDVDVDCSLHADDKYCYLCGQPTNFNLEGFFENHK